MRAPICINAGDCALANENLPRVPAPCVAPSGFHHEFSVTETTTLQATSVKIAAAIGHAILHVAALFDG
jgi:hypothetical protein